MIQYVYVISQTSKALTVTLLTTLVVKFKLDVSEKSFEVLKLEIFL